MASKRGSYSDFLKATKVVAKRQCFVKRDPCNFESSVAKLRLTSTTKVYFIVQFYLDLCRIVMFDYVMQ